MNSIKKVVELLKERDSYDFTGCSYEMLKRRIKLRFLATDTTSYESYYQYLENHQEESEKLMQSITIKVSNFFRNALDFEILNKLIGNMLYQKKENGESLRIWSSGCATGEEPYSIAIIIAEYEKDLNVPVNIFGTDIDNQVLDKAMDAIYTQESMKEIKFGLLTKYFKQSDGRYFLNETIKDMVDFSYHDQLNHKTMFPSESIYGDFDLVLCRNVLIYYSLSQKFFILERLYNALRIGGYLMLGEAEDIEEEYVTKLQQIAPYTKIYRKII